ncbi:MAG: 50S ribosomal protein L22 [Bacilli bacterium]|jgi:large subunit ribosomal protein L22|nr:50S ribosomal protein L22 [Bacilli bacterium]
METRAIAKRVRISPIKARLVIDLIRGKEVDEALAILKNTNKKAAPLIQKVLESAIANATNNAGLKREELIVKEAFINEGRTLKRIKARARGSVGHKDHRTSQINIVVAAK